MTIKTLLALGFATSAVASAAFAADCYWINSDTSAAQSYTVTTNWKNGVAPGTGGGDDVYIDGNAHIDLNGANIRSIYHRAGELTLAHTTGKISLNGSFYSWGTKVNYKANTYLPSGTHVFSNACLVACSDGVTFDGPGNFLKTGKGTWGVVDFAHGYYSTSGRLEVQQGVFSTFQYDYFSGPTTVRVNGPTARLDVISEHDNTFNGNVQLEIGGSGRIYFKFARKQTVRTLFIQDIQTAGGTWKPYPHGLEDGYRCWGDIYGGNTEIVVTGGASKNPFQPLGADRDSRRTRTWTNAAGDNDPGNPANWKEGVPAWICDNVVVDAPNAPEIFWDFGGQMIYHSLTVNHDWNARSFTLWGDLHLNGASLTHGWSTFTLAGAWEHVVDGSGWVNLVNGTCFAGEGALTLAGTGGLVYPMYNGTGVSTVKGDLTVRGGAQIRQAANCGLGKPAFPDVARVTVTGVGSRIDLGTTAAFTNTVALSVTDGARVRLAAGVDQTVRALYTDGRRRPARVYTGSGAAGVTIPDYLAGEGTVTATSGSSGLVILGHGK